MNKFEYVATVKDYAKLPDDSLLVITDKYKTLLLSKNGSLEEIKYSESDNKIDMARKLISAIRGS